MPRPAHWTLLLALPILLALIASCSQEPELSPQARAFQQSTRQILLDLGAEMKAPLQRGDKEAIDAKLEAVYQKAARAGRPLSYGLAVMAGQGRLLAGRYPGHGGKQGGSPANPGSRYAKYQQMSQVWDDGQATACKLYYPGGEMYAVGVPVIGDGGILGMVCIGYTAGDLKKAGVDEKTFFALKYD